MRRLGFALVLIACAAVAGGSPFAPLPVSKPARAAPGDQQFTTVAGATAHVWPGSSMALGATGGTLPPAISAVFQWSNGSQSFKFWFRGFPANFNTLASLEKNGFYFFQGSGGTLVTVPNSANYTLPLSPTTFQTTPGATGQLWLGASFAPDQLPAPISAVFRWKNESQSFQFWFRGFPANFNTLPPMLAQGEFYFFQANSVVTVTEPALQNSAQLIDAALAAGTLPPLPNTTVPESSLVYKMFGEFGDARLPASLNGFAVKGAEPQFAQDAAANFASLSPAAKALAQPFLLPPSSPGSWYELKTSARSASGARLPVLWDSLSSTNVKVSWPQTAPALGLQAQTLLDEMETKIWPQLVGLMGVAPPSDASQSSNGGDGKFDVYFIEDDPSNGWAGIAQPYPGVSCPTARPSYITVEAQNSFASTLSVAGHEFMHSIEFAFTACGHFPWLVEATATWAEDFLYPNQNDEQRHASAFLDSLADGYPVSRYEYLLPYQYGAYLWLQFLSKTVNNDVIRQIWTRTGGPGPLDDIAGALGGAAAMAERWHEFAIQTLNFAPYDAFSQWDALNSSGIQAVIVDTVPHVAERHVIVPPYGVNTFWVLSQQTPNYARVRIVNPFSANADARIRILVDRGGDWQPVELLTDEFHRYCGLISSGGIGGIVVVVSNDGSTTGAVVEGDLEFEFTDSPCTMHVETSVTQDYRISGDDPIERHWNITASFDIELRLGPDTGEYIYDSLPGGTLNWSLNDVECTPHNSSGSFTIGSQTTNTVGYARFREVDSSNTYFTPAVFNPFNLENIRTTCAGGLTDTDPPAFWFAGPSGKPSSGWEDGFTGSYNIHDVTGNTTVDQHWSWTVTNK
jgi:hypothetical protein